MKRPSLPPHVLLVLSLACAPAMLRAAEDGARPMRREVGTLVLDGVPEIPARIVERTAQYQNVRGALLLDWDPTGGGLLVATRFAETSQVHRVGTPGGYREQLTFFAEPVANAEYDPARGPSGFFFRMDRGGAERHQYYWLERATGRHILVTDGVSRNEGLLVSRAGGRYAYASTRRNQQDFDLYVGGGMDPAAARLVLEVKGQWTPLDWSSGDERLLVMHDVSANETYLHVLDLATGKLTEVNPRPAGAPLVAYGNAAFGASKDVLFYTSNEDSEFLQLVRFDLLRGKKEIVTTALPWDVRAMAVSLDGAWLAYTVNEGGRSALFLAPATKPAKAVRVDLPQGVVSGLRFDRQSKRLGFTMSTAQSPADVYSIDLKTRRLTRWTYSEVGGLDPQTFVTPELIEYPTFDGRRIPAWYYHPRGPGPFPVIVSIHGGPEGQSDAGFEPLLQYFVNELGAAVLEPNVRGSSGYGKSYLLLDNGTKREDSVKDIGALLDWIATRPELDKDRVAVYGASYGGYMVLASMIHFSDRLRCGIDIVGISNFVTFLENTEAYRRDLRRVEYGDERDPEMRRHLSAIAPTAQAHRIRRPLFVVQGLNDPRVPASESEQIVRTLRQGGTGVWYMLAKDEGHGFRKKQNRDAYLNAATLFLEQHLLPSTKPPAGR